MEVAEDEMNDIHAVRLKEFYNVKITVLAFDNCEALVCKLKTKLYAILRQITCTKHSRTLTISVSRNMEYNISTSGIDRRKPSERRDKEVRIGNDSNRGNHHLILIR